LAVVGLADPLVTLDQLIERLPKHQRLDMSFTTGLKPSANRRFRLHVFPPIGTATQRRLASLRVDCVSASLAT
jgi:hypothetical protein